MRSSHQSQWDFYMHGRLMFWGGKEEGDNVFLTSSEMVRTGRVPEALLTNEIVSITQSAEETERFDQMRVNPSTRSAQRGPEVWHTLYKFLLTSSKALPQHAKPLVGAGDEVVICDMHVHSGDHGLGACTLMSDLAANHVVLRHVMVKLKDKKSISAALWSQKRISSHLCNKWLKHEVKLFSKSGAVVPALETEVTATWLRFLLVTGNWQMLMIWFLWYNWHMTTGNPCYNWHMTTGNPCYNWHMTTGTWQQLYF